MPMRIVACLLLAAMFGIAQAEEKNYITPTVKTPIWPQAQDQAEFRREMKNGLLSEDQSIPDKTRNIVSKRSDDEAVQRYGCKDQHRVP